MNFKDSILRIFRLAEIEWWGNRFIISFNLKNRTYDILKIKEPVITPIIFPTHESSFGTKYSFKFNNISKDVAHVLREYKVDEKNPKKRKQIESVRYVLSESKNYYIIEGWDERTKKTEVNIPAYIDGLPVRYIGNRAFYKAPFKKIIFDPECSFKGIYDGAFAHSSLEEISLPKTVAVLSSYTFLECKNLTKITIPASISHVSNSIFGYNKDLIRIKEVVIDYSYGDNSKHWSRNWNVFKIPVKKIGKKSFKDFLKKHNKK